MGILDQFVGFTIDHGLTKATLKICQLVMITKMIQGFDKDV